MIDRDPRYFAPVLNYLRHGKLILDSNISPEGVLEEAEFYNITHLIMLLKENIQRRDHCTTVDNKQRVYRVLQCQENELTHVSDHYNIIKTLFHDYLICIFLDGVYHE